MDLPQRKLSCACPCNVAGARVLTTAGGPRPFMRRGTVFSSMCCRSCAEAAKLPGRHVLARKAAAQLPGRSGCGIRVGLRKRWRSTEDFCAADVPAPPENGNTEADRDLLPGDCGCPETCENGCCPGAIPTWPGSVGTDGWEPPTCRWRNRSRSRGLTRRTRLRAS